MKPPHHVWAELDLDSFAGRGLEHGNEPVATEQARALDLELWGRRLRTEAGESVPALHPGISAKLRAHATDTGEFLRPSAAGEPEDEEA
jgi:hypothetical protein